MKKAWCRACGDPQPTQSGPCSQCAAELSVGSPPDSLIGLAYAVRGRFGLGRRIGVCVDHAGDELVLHLSAKDPEGTRLPRSSPPLDLVSSTYSPAARLIYAADVVAPMQAWDAEQLRRRSAELCADISVLRWLFDESIVLGWSHIAAWAALSPSEKTWRLAHHAASTGDLQNLRTRLEELPDSGYPHRGELLLPYLSSIRDDAGTWADVLERLDRITVVAGPEIRTALTESPDAALRAGVSLLPAQQRESWAAIRSGFANPSTIVSPTTAATPAWTAAALLARSKGPGALDRQADELLGLEPELLDDLVDDGRLRDLSGVARVSPARRYLLARLDPAALSDHDLEHIGHVAELARRRYLARDRASLSALGTHRRVQHYQALAAAADGAEYDETWLDADTRERLRNPFDVLAMLKDVPGQSLPADIAADPSLWPIFTEDAISGRLGASADRSADDPLNVWIGSLRLLGLVWEGQFSAAVEHGKLLLRHVHHERARDEVLNLTAFALSQLGRYEEALDKLDNAVAGDFTENLLVNISMIAAQVRPETGVRHLARLVENAPPDLQRAGLYQAIGIWRSSDMPFPQVLVPALRSALGVADQSIPDFLRFAQVAVDEMPETVISMPSPRGELAEPFQVMRAEARLVHESNYFLADLAKDYCRVYRSAGRTEWFEDLWQKWVRRVNEGVFAEFGESIGAAQFIDVVIIDAPELFTDVERWEMAPQAGAHLAAKFARDGELLNDRAWSKFFFVPMDEFLARRSSLPASTASLLAENLVRCLGQATMHRVGITRDETAARYNNLIERLRWDEQNRYAINAQRRQILDDILAGPIAELDLVIARMRRLGVNHEGLENLIRALAQDVDSWRDETYQLRREV